MIGGHSGCPEATTGRPVPAINPPITANTATNTHRIFRAFIKQYKMMIFESVNLGKCSMEINKQWRLKDDPAD
jgi:hypothetical protein